MFTASGGKEPQAVIDGVKGAAVANGEAVNDRVEDHAVLTDRGEALIGGDTDHAVAVEEIHSSLPSRSTSNTSQMVLRRKRPRLNSNDTQPGRELTEDSVKPSRETPTLPRKEPSQTPSPVQYVVAGVRTSTGICVFY